MNVISSALRKKESTHKDPGLRWKGEIMLPVHRISWSLVLLVACCEAFEVHISSNETAAAGKEVESTISILDGGTADAFRLYLASSSGSSKAQGGSTNASCTLEQWITLDNQTISFTIPPSVGPDSGGYSLQLSLWKNGDVFPYTVDSSTFKLGGATGNSSASYPRIYNSFMADDIPCSSLSCVQQCESSLGAASEKKQFFECATGCKGVVSMPEVMTVTDPGQTVTSMDTSSATTPPSATMSSSSTETSSALMSSSILSVSQTSSASLQSTASVASASTSASTSVGGVEKAAEVPATFRLVELCLAALACLVSM